MDMRLKLLALMASLLVGSEALADKLPEPFNPWSDVQADQSNATEQDREFFDLISRFLKNGSFPSDSMPARLKMGQALQVQAAKGDVRAKLVWLAQFSPMDLKPPPNGNPQIIEAFEKVDASQDMRLLYEVGKLMQLRYSLCVNLYEDSGIKVGDRRCQVSYDSPKTAFLQKRLYERMIGYFLKSAQMGYPPAQYEVGYLLSENAVYKYGSSLDLLVAAEKSSKDWLAMSAGAGNVQAKNLLDQITQEEGKNQALFAAKEKERLEQEAVSAKTKPKCENIVFTGIAANFREDIATTNKSKDIADILSAHPLVCETVSGGRNFNGAIMEPYSRTKCKGVALLKNHRAKIIDWTPDMYYVSTEVDFDTGRMPLALWINRSSARCATK
jgi:hypothetical protein